MEYRGVLAWVYALTVLIGALSIIYPTPVPVWVDFGLHITYIYAMMLFFGGIAGLFAIYRPNYKVELVGLWFVLGGYAIYDIALWSLVTERILIATEIAPPFRPALIAAALAVFCTGRIIYLVKQNHELVKAADADGLD